MNTFPAANAALIADLSTRLPAALRVAAERIAATARANAPAQKKSTRLRVPGTLRNDIAVVQSTSPGRFRASVGVFNPEAYYWRWQEFGYRAVGSRSGGPGRQIQGKHFLARAFDSNVAPAAALVAGAAVAAINQANQS